MTEFSDLLSLSAKENGFSHWGWTNIGESYLESVGRYQAWLDKNYHGEMEYLKNHLQKKKSPENTKSVICLAHSYLDLPGESNFPLKNAKVARYARGEDYHFWLKEKTERIITLLNEKYPNESFQSAVDSSPVLERGLALQSGLGWIGKNSCLIHEKHGSFFFLAEIMTSLKLSPNSNTPYDRCGTCTACIDACPTDAIKEDREIDASLCISYLNIEKRGLPEKNLRSKMKDWFYGCDICQDVCPWNRKVKVDSQKIKNREDLLSELKWILRSSNKHLEKSFSKTALTRAGGKGLKRNAIIVATNEGLQELLPEIEKLKDHEYFAELVEWSCEELNPKLNTQTLK